MCEESSHMCEACSHFPQPSCLACLLQLCLLHMRVKLTHTCVRSHASHTSSTSWSCHHQRFLTHVWASCPLWLVINPNPCGAYLASTSLILRDPSPSILHWISTVHFPIKGEPSPHFKGENMKHYLSHCYVAGFVSYQIPQKWNHQHLGDFVRFALVLFFVD